MASTSTGSDPAATHLTGNDDSTEKYFDGMSSDAEGYEAETPQARQAKAEALAHARAARAARAKYTRLASQPAGGSNRNPHNTMQAESFYDLMAAQGDRIGGTEASLVATRVADQFRNAFLDDFLEGDRTHPAAKAGVAGLISWLPLLPLRNDKRDGGVGGFLSDPRVLSFGAITLVALGETFKENIRKIFDTNERLKSVGDQVNGQIAALSDHSTRTDDRLARIEKRVDEGHQRAATTTGHDQSS
jgi:hypothetical protein